MFLASVVGLEDSCPASSHSARLPDSLQTFLLGHFKVNLRRERINRTTADNKATQQKKYTYD